MSDTTDSYTYNHAKVQLQELISGVIHGNSIQANEFLPCIKTMMHYGDTDRDLTDYYINVVRQCILDYVATQKDMANLLVMSKVLEILGKNQFQISSVGIN